MRVIDNNAEKLKDALIQSIQAGDKVSIAAGFFSIYAFRELAEQLKDVAEFRFLYTTPSFVKGKKSKKGTDKEAADEQICGTEFESRLRNELTQRSIAKEFAAWAKNENIHFKSNNTHDHIDGFAVIQSGSKRGEMVAYTPLKGLTTVELGCSPSSDYSLISELDAPYAKQYLALFDSVWRDAKHGVDVKEAVLAQVEEICAEQSPESVYYSILFNIFSEFLHDISDDDYAANERVGFKNSVIWEKLYDYQKDAALAIINKLERFNGCILADSVGLGKTFTALAVIKYYESRNKSVLVLCPKRLKDNWNTFNHNQIGNPLVRDRFGYEVLFHTDLNRIDSNGTSNGIDLAKVNWANYDLVVIDESHNFRNGSSDKKLKKNRYDILVERILGEGVKTKVLMLSATPVNNRFSDLRNQLALAYYGDSSAIEEGLNISTTVDGVFIKAQKVFNKWSNLPAAQRTTESLLDKLDFDFFELLDGVTIARSRKHIQQYYDMNAIGAFPQRLPPKSLSPQLSCLQNVAGYDELFESLLSLNLSVYTPSYFILPDRRKTYEQKFGANIKGFSQESREKGLQRLMAINLLKRLESSTRAFALTLDRICEQIAATLNDIEGYLTKNKEGSIACTGADFFDEEFDEPEDLILTAKSVKIAFKDMDIGQWKETLEQDMKVMESLKAKVSLITAQSDNKLQELKNIIEWKSGCPVNAGNRKLLIFTAFSDTAEYLYDNISGFCRELGLHAALVTGSVNKTTVAGLPTEFNTLLTCFSPKSKQRDLYPNEAVRRADIDILIGTDCISEGQNLQDCDICVNYDIHWNPVRIIQRYGRIDRIGSENKYIQLINFWPDVSLDSYINLKQRVETRMKIVGIAATPEENVITDEEKADLEYRKSQLERIRTEAVDIEDVSDTVSITDLGLNEFKLDLLHYEKNRQTSKPAKLGSYAVVSATPEVPAGIILVLKCISQKAKIKDMNRLHPYYLVYIGEDGGVRCNYLTPKDTLTILRSLCKGRAEPDREACTRFNHVTQQGENMSAYSSLFKKAIGSIIETNKEAMVSSLFKSGKTGFGKSNQIEGMDDFELISFLVVK